MRRPLFAFLFAAIAGCSLSLGLNGESNRPCQNGTCLDGYVCFKDLCVPKSGAECKATSDCPNGYCVDGGCELPPCSDTKKNYRETDLDCGGGFCGKCGDLKGCKVAFDCKSQVCSDAGSCSIPACDDLALNGTETDVDCGGDAGCARCTDGLICQAGSDCTSGSCDGVCQPGACIDLVKNGLETDIDCGGPCKKCANGKTCLLGKDCTSLVCTSGINKCAVPTCSDSQKNGAETDLDCGGGACQKCADAKVCAGGTDCINGVCQNATCRPAHCGNGTEDVDESDKDCGGLCKKCGLGDDCNRDSDCGSNNCLFGNTYCGP